MATSLADSVSIVGSDSERGVIEAIFIGKFGIFIIDIGVVDFTYTHFSNFIWVEETEFYF
jgi:hypothetical protein